MKTDSGAADARSTDSRCVVVTVGVSTIVPLTDWNAELFCFEPHEIEVMAKMEQERYVQERLREGWTYAEVKDLGAKTNPDLVPWDELSESGRKNCWDAVADLPVFLARAGFEVRRVK